MGIRESYSRRSALGGASIAWLLGLLTGFWATRSYDAVATSAKQMAPTATVSPIAQIQQSSGERPPAIQEKVSRMQLVFNRTCPHITLEELRVREEGDERRVTLTAVMNNADTGRSCAFTAKSLYLRDGEGKNHSHQTADGLTFPPLSGRRVRLTYRVPETTSIAKLVVDDYRDPFGVADLDLEQGHPR